MKNELENWKDMVGYEGLYQVSNLGRVKSFRGLKERILRSVPKNNYYCKVNLRVNRVDSIRLVHRLAAVAFIPNPENKPFINHINGIKIDNRIENLEWCTQKENVHHGIRTGLTKRRSTIPVMQLSMNNEFIKEYPSMTEASKATGALVQNIWKCVNGKARSANKSKWILKAA